MTTAVVLVVVVLVMVFVVVKVAESVLMAVKERVLGGVDVL